MWFLAYLALCLALTPVYNALGVDGWQRFGCWVCLAIAVQAIARAHRNTDSEV